MELEEAKKELQEKIRYLYRHINNYEKSNCKTNIYCELVKEKNALETVLQALDNSITKEKVKEGIESIEDYFDRLNGPDEDIDFIREIKQELLEE